MCVMRDSRSPFLKLHRKKSKTFDTSSINFRREEALLKFDLLHERGDICE